MSSIRVLVGTKKGAFMLSADGKRQKWTVAGPDFGGRDAYFPLVQAIEYTRP